MKRSEMRGWRAGQERVVGFSYTHATVLQMPFGVHFVMEDANDLNAAVSHAVIQNMRPGRKLAVAFSYFGNRTPHQRIDRKQADVAGNLIDL
jgi:hypothetical protein